MTDMSKIDTAGATPTVDPRQLPTVPMSTRRHQPTPPRTKEDRIFMEMMRDLNGDATYHAAATAASYALGVIGAAVFLAILSAVLS